MDSFIEITPDNFEQKVIYSQSPVLLEFGAEWCAPCKRLEPVLKQLAGVWSGKVQVAKLDVDECIDITTSYQIMSVPTTMLFINGEPVERFTGFQPKDRILAKVEPHINS